ncbi:15080_t:CDS:1, partial [Gigaspora margarita]
FIPFSGSNCFKLEKFLYIFIVLEAVAKRIFNIKIVFKKVFNIQFLVKLFC